MMRRADQISMQPPKKGANIVKEKDFKIEQSSTAKTSRRSFLKAGAAAAGAALLGAGLTQAQEKQEEVQFLFVQTAHDVVMGKDCLTLIGVSPTTLFFSDRPKRIAGHMTTEDFVLEWKQGKSKEGFHADPPNATLSIFAKEEIVDVVVELKNPRLAGGALVYDIDVVEEDEPVPSGPVSLFIDPAGMRRRRRRRHRRRVRHVVH
jgi:hypothetical protein